MKRLTKKLLKLTEAPARPIPPEILAQYRWGVFKEPNGAFYANTYFNEMSYPYMVQGNLSQADAETLAAEKNKK